MDTKKVAEALYQKYREINPESHNALLRKRKAKLSAILCVDEILEAHHSCEDCEEEGSMELRDWGKVKEHLNNM